MVSRKNSAPWPIWKASLFGNPKNMVQPRISSCTLMMGSYSPHRSQPPSIRRILGSKNILELSGNDHKRVRGALVSFLKLEVLKQYVAKLDEEVQPHLLTYWHGKHEIQVRIFYPSRNSFLWPWNKFVMSIYKTCYKNCTKYMYFL